MERPEVNINAPALERLKLREDEKSCYYALFKEADKGDLGIITGQDAVQFFARTQLLSNFLGQLWQIVDVENRGFLTLLEFCQFLRLISHAQNSKGAPITSALINQPAPLPRFYPSESSAIPQISKDDVAKYHMQFYSLSPNEGILTGSVVQSLLLASQLPADRLGWIWNASKKDQSHSNFSVDEFTTAMHLVSWFKTRGPSSSISPNVTGQAAPSHMPTLPMQPNPTSSLAGNPMMAPPVAQTPSMTGTAAPPGMPTLQDIDNLFNSVRGDQPYLSGEAASNFFERYHLSSDVLADIWDLADMDSDGNLDKDEFTIAIQLIYLKLSYPNQPVPKTLPDYLIPVSKRAYSHQSAPMQNQSVLDTVVQPKPVVENSSAAIDLLSLDMGETLPAPEIPLSNNTTGSAAPQFAAASSFKPTSSFGQGILAQHTSGSQASGISSNKVVDPMPNQDAVAITAANNEASRLAQSSSELKATKERLQQNEQQASSELKILQLRLSQLRSQYETEEKHVTEIRQNVEAAYRSNALVKQEFGNLTDEYSKLEAERATLTTKLESLRADNATTKEKIRTSADAISKLRTEIEKKKNEVKAQSNLSAVLSTQKSGNEQEVKKLESELSNLSLALAAAPVHDIASQAQTLSNSSSPAPNMNPFRRRAQHQSEDTSLRSAPSPSVKSEILSVPQNLSRPQSQQSPFDTAGPQQSTSNSTFTGLDDRATSPTSQSFKSIVSKNESSSSPWPGMKDKSVAVSSVTSGSRVASPLNVSKDIGAAAKGPLEQQVTGSSGGLISPPRQASFNFVLDGENAGTGSVPTSTGPPPTSFSFANNFPPVEQVSGSSSQGADPTSKASGKDESKLRFQYDKFEAEFPPISSRRPDEDDEGENSDDSSFEGGFDDDFTTTTLGVGADNGTKTAGSGSMGWPSGSDNGRAESKSAAGPFTGKPEREAGQSGVSLSNSMGPSLKELSVNAGVSDFDFDDLKPAVEVEGSSGEKAVAVDDRTNFGQNKGFGKAESSSLDAFDDPFSIAADGRKGEQNASWS